MSRSRHTEAQMIGALMWRGKWEFRSTRSMPGKHENTRLRKLVADLSLDKEALQSVIRKNGWSS